MKWFAGSIATYLKMVLKIFCQILLYLVYLYNKKATKSSNHILIMNQSK